MDRPPRVDVLALRDELRVRPPLPGQEVVLRLPPGVALDPVTRAQVEELVRPGRPKWVASEGGNAS